MVQVVIVAGGLATRMLPITEDIPKCMVDINGKPLLEHQLEQFKSQGFTDFIFCVAHLAEKVEEHFNDGSAFGVSIKYVHEVEQLMGTAGSVKLAESLISGDEFILYYGDNLTSIDFNKLLKMHRLKHSLATIVVRPAPAGYKGSSLITLDPNYKLKEFIEKPDEKEFTKRKDSMIYINNGIYVFHKEVLGHIPDNQPYDFSKELFPKLLFHELMVFGYPTSEFHREIGRIEKYTAFLEEVKGKDSVFPPK